MAIPNRPPSLGHVVRQVQHLSRHLIESHSKLSELTDKLNSIEQLSSNELTSFLPSGTGDKVSSSDKRKIAAETMSQMIVRKEHEIRLSGSAIESAAFLVWKHLEYFLLYANSSGTSTLTPYQRAHLRKGNFIVWFVLVSYCKKTYPALFYRRYVDG